MEVEIPRVCAGMAVRPHRPSHITARQPYAIADEGYAKGAQGQNDPLRINQGAPSSTK
jgi:hypothetical protein